jgi:hypothetical protein
MPMFPHTADAHASKPDKVVVLAFLRRRLEDRSKGAVR